MKRLALPCALPAAFAVLASPAHAQRRWGLEIGHSYSSTQALHQPATFAVNVADSVTTVLDGGVLIGGPPARCRLPPRTRRRFVTDGSERVRRPSDGGAKRLA